MGQIQTTSAIVLAVPAALVLLGDSTWLLIPHSIPDKLKDGAAMRMIYGPLCGVGPGYMDKFDGVFAYCQLLPMIVCVSISSSNELAQVLAVLFLSLNCAFIWVVGNYMAIAGIFPGYAPCAFIVVWGNFAGNLLWRCMTVDFGVPAKYIPVVVAWQAITALIGYMYIRRMHARVEGLTNSIKLWFLKGEALEKGATWKRGSDNPEPFEPDTNIAKAAQEEQTNAQYTPFWLLCLCMLCILGALGAATAVVASSDATPDESVRDYMFINLGIVILMAVYQIYTNMFYVNKAAAVGPNAQGYGTMAEKLTDGSQPE